MMTSPRLIVCEKTNWWSLALRRQLPAEIRSAVRETRSCDECWEQTLESPRSMVVLEVTVANLERVATELVRYRSRFPHARTVVLGNRHLADVEWLLRELGAVFVAFSSRDLRPLVRMIERHWGRFAQQQAVGESALWQELPWGSARQSQRNFGFLR